MNITFLGAGYVGATTAAHFSGPHKVTVYDPDESKINSIKKVIDGSNDFYIDEKGLVEKIRSNKEKLNPTSDLGSALSTPNIIFIAVGTPPNEKGRANLEYVVETAQAIGQQINQNTIVLTKSTVPPGTGYMVEEIIQQELDKRDSKIKINVGSCPEFLAEGTAMRDLETPARVVFGMEDHEATKQVIQFFRTMYGESTITHGSVLESELTKYIANSALANKLSFYNEMAGLCDELGADAKKVISMVCKDPRIGARFNKPGFGYGGSCFPKDTRAIAQYATILNMPLEMVEATINVNKTVLNRFEQKIYDAFNGTVEGMNIGIWGVGFKKDTDDLRESRSVELAKRLMAKGARVHIYDIVPGALRNFKREVNGNYEIYDTQYGMFEKPIDALIIGNDNIPFRTIDLNQATFRGKRIFDGKNQLSAQEIKALQFEGFTYFSVGQDIHAGKVNKEQLIRLLKESYMR